MVKSYTPDRGDIIKLSFSPQVAREQAQKALPSVRPALVLSPLAYNRISHFILACPITNTVKGWKFEVVLPQSMQTSGVVLADQIKVLDWRSRKAKFIEKATAEVIEEALAKALVLIS